LKTASVLKSKRKKAQEYTTALNFVSPPMLAVTARTNFEIFRLFVNNHVTYNHHKGWIEKLNTGINSKCLHGIAGQDTLLLAPRGSSKSTFLIEWVAWNIGVHSSPEILLALKVLYISHELKTARQKSQQIQRLIQSPAYRQVFPWVKPGENWAKELWEIDFAHAGLPRADEPYTIAAAGLVGNTAGKRSHLLILDDLIKSPASISNPDIRDQMVSNWRNVIKPTRFEGSRAVVLGTQMTANDFYCTETTPENGWNVIRESAIIHNELGEEISYWEPVDDKSPGQSLEFLKSIRESEPETFSFQYQNKVIAISTQAIGMHLIVKNQIPAEMDILVLGCDLSAGVKQKNDYTTFVLGGMVTTNRRTTFYTIDVWKGRLMGNMKKLEAIENLYETWSHLCPFMEICFESNAYQLSFKGDYYDYVAGNNLYNWRVKAVPSIPDKLMRLRGVSGILENRQHVFNVYGRNMGELITQITEFGSTSHDDLADGWEKMLSGLRARQPLSTANY
jgi:phage terminase large subunit-like protein